MFISMSFGMLFFFALFFFILGGLSFNWVVNKIKKKFK